MSFMRLDRIRGGSKAPGFIGWIVIDSVTGGLRGVGGSGQRGFELGSYIFTTTDRIAFPSIVQMAASGNEIGSGEVVMGGVIGGVFKRAFRIEFKSATISTAQVFGGPNGTPGVLFSIEAESHRFVPQG